MGIPRWRLALTGSAILVFGLIGMGAVSAAPAKPETAAAGAVLPQVEPVDPEASPDAQRHGRGHGRHPGFAKHLVHGVITLDTPDEGLITVQLDHGTLAAIGNGSITISEAGGSSVTVNTSEETRVRKDGHRAALEDLEVGDEVFVSSRVDGTTTARLILVPKPAHE